MGRSVTTSLFLILPAIAGAQVPPDYWPLQIGNRWIYDHSWTDEEGVVRSEVTILEVVAQRQIDNNSYFELSNGQLLRKDELGNIVEYSEHVTSLEDREFVLFDFSVPPGDELFVEAGDTLAYAIFPPNLGSPGKPTRLQRIRDPGRTVRVPAGEFTTFSFLHGDGLVEGFVIDFAPNVGIVRSVKASDVQEDREGYLLAEAFVGGLRIPGETLVRSPSWGTVKSR